MEEHGRFDYSAIARRPPLRLPDGARVAVWVVPNIEHFHFDKSGIAIAEATVGCRPDVMNYGWRDYGVRVGIWRLMELLERQGFTATASVNSEVCRHYPAIVEEGNRLGWEWMAHGQTNSKLITGLEEADERAIIADVLGTIERATGKRPRGWLGPALTETLNTLDLLAEAGVQYVADWCNDDQPYRMRTRAGALVAMPYTLEAGDIPAILGRGESPEQFARTIMDQFDVLYEEGARSARVMNIAVHPFLIGHAFRAKHFERALAHIKAHDKVWITRGCDILDWYLKSGATL